MTTSFNIWFFKKDHKHHHSAMILFYLYGGIFFTLVGILGFSISEILALACFILSGISFASGFYYIVNNKNRQPKTFETKIAKTEEEALWFWDNG